VRKKLAVLVAMALMGAMSAAPALAFADGKPPHRASCQGQFHVANIQEIGGRQSGQENAMFARQSEFGGFGRSTSAVARISGLC